MQILKCVAIFFLLLGESLCQEGVCSSQNCKLPNCFCAGRQGPLQLQTQDIPQMVVFTFDDALNEENYPFYTRLFRSGRNNPNGCPIAATFFVSHDWTNYDYVRELYIDGHEIASHSITHKMPQSWWSRASYAELKEELEGQRKNIVHHAKIPKNQIRGIRVPFWKLERYSVCPDEKWRFWVWLFIYCGAVLWRRLAPPCMALYIRVSTRFGVLWQPQLPKG